MELSSSQKISANAIVSAIRHPFLILAEDLQVLSANKAFYNTFKITPEEVEQKNIYEINNCDWDIPKLHTLFEQEIIGSSIIDNFGIEHTFKSVGYKKLILNCSYLPTESKSKIYFLAIEDSTYNVVEENKNLCDLRMNELIDAIPAALYTTDAEGKITMFNKAAVEFSGRVPRLGVDSWCVTWKQFTLDGTPMPHTECTMSQTLKSGRPIRGVEAIAERPDGSRVTFIPYPTPIFDLNGNLTGAVNMLVDITDRKVVEDASQLLAAIVESSTDAILSLDNNGIILTWNKGAENLSGKKAVDIIGSPISEIIPEEQLEEEKAIFESIVKNKITKHFDTTRPKADGTLYSLAITASPIKNIKGKMTGVSVIAHDVTSRKKVELALRKSEERYVLAEKATNDGLWDWETKNGYTYLSPRWKALLGFSEVEVPNRIESFFSKIHPEDQVIFNEALEEHLKNDKPFNIEARLQRKDGSYRWFRTRGQAMRNEEGEIFRMVGSIRNISYRKEKEEQLKFSERRYRRIFEAAQDGILMMDPNTFSITDANPYILDLTGYDKNELFGRQLYEIGLIKDKGQTKELFEELKEKNYIRYDNACIQMKNGKYKDVEFIGNIYQEGGTEVIQCNIRDISERKKHEAVKETELLLTAEKLRTEFIADATHELRTPLAIIKGNVDLGLKLQKSSTSSLKAIGVEVKHLSDLLSDLTILTTKDTQSERQIHKEEVNVTDLINSAASRCQTLANNKEISIKINDIPAISILGDKLYLEKLFINIINNAIIYGNIGGHVVLSAKIIDKKIEILVRDDGIGISEEDLLYIFERFYRTDKARTGNGGGTGLGLAISKWIVESHDGSILAKSNTPEPGMTFIILLPY